MPVKAQLSAPPSCLIKSSVSPEFINGLHYKYLVFIARQLQCEIEILPMPFARRVVSLENGDIDIMVGLKHLHQENGFEFIRPSYETIQGVYFVRREDIEKYVNPQAFDNAVVGVSIDQVGITETVQSDFKDIVPVTNLGQKIGLLLKGRIDTFVHFQSSADFKINQMGVADKIGPAPYQPGFPLDYYVALHTGSALYARKAELAKIISDAVAQGIFAKIRAEHEASLDAY
ncbi:transporter substrate-binding domain-containing protein [Alteromonas sp. ASW11-36]|uniref:Transporter substrate-binding domain-containing protein n=1 Tax=Alteromonas arenosi TaxID=3055817 RepID=A0ABT7SXZ8_9ALTE|nr:transporter substrate-binding domain-containing protein [Alteromonas sp. ASW11-36]MDM7861063.1 transporter substrate-binding domain-containing protein [Alteromonas sp. ASW11-36]